MDLLATVSADAEWESTFHLDSAGIAEQIAIELPESETPRQQALRLLEAIVAEVGEDYKYPTDNGTDNGSCHYVDVVLPTGDTANATSYLVYDYAGDNKWHGLRTQEPAVTGSCILGRLVEKAQGVETLRDLALQHNDDPSSDIEDFWPEGWTDDEGLIYALDCAQGWQDSHYAYGKVLQGVRLVLDRFGPEKQVPHQVRPFSPDLPDLLALGEDYHWSGTI